MVGWEVTERENEEAEHDGDAHFEFGQSVEGGHFVLQRNDGIVGDAVEEQRQAHQAHDYPAVAFLLVLAALEILSNRRHVLQDVRNLHLDLHFQAR